MWAELVQQKDKWIGGQLIDYGDEMDRRLNVNRMKDGTYPMKTAITDMVLTDEVFEVIGKDFSCMGNRQYLGIEPNPEFELPKDGIAFSGYGGHEWHIVKPTEGDKVQKTVRKYSKTKRVR